MRKWKNETSLVNVFSNEDMIIPEDRHYQQFLKFIRDDRVRVKIEKIRNNFDINPILILQKVDKYKELVRGNVNRVTQNRLIKTKLIQKELEAYVDRRLTIQRVRGILKSFDKPCSWEKPLIAHILTGARQAPFDRFLIFIDGKRFRIEISPDITDIDLKTLYKEINKRQADFSKLYSKGQKFTLRRMQDRLILTICPHVTVRELRKLSTEIHRLKRGLQGADSIKGRKQRDVQSKIVRAYTYKDYLNQSKGKSMERRNDLKLKLLVDRHKFIGDVMLGRKSWKTVAKEDKFYNVEEQKRIENNERQNFKRYRKYVKQ